MTPAHYLFGFGFFGVVYLLYMVVFPRFHKWAKRRTPEPRTSAADIAPATARLALPDEQPVLASLVGRDVNALASYLHDLRGRWDDRAYVCRMFEDLIDRDMLEYALHQQPQSAVHYLMRGCRRHAWAWEARGHGAASQVSEEGWQLFGERMRAAESDFLQAAALDPADPTPHARLVALACHLDRGEQAAYTHLVEALRRDPESYGALDTYLQYFCAPHWGGSVDKSLAFARRHAAGAPAGSARPMLLLEAHYDAFHSEHAFGKRGDAHAYAARPEVQQEIVGAYHASIGNPAHRPTRRTNELRNLAAWWFYVIRDRDRCRRELGLVGNAFTDAYWQRLGRPAKQIAAVRTWLDGGKWKEIGW